MTKSARSKVTDLASQYDGAVHVESVTASQCTITFVSAKKASEFINDLSDLRVFRYERLDSTTIKVHF